MINSLLQNLLNLRILAMISSLLLASSAILSNEGIQTTDDFSRTVKLAAPAQRIVSLAPHLTELIDAAQAANKLVGVSRRCDYPPAVQRLPKISNYQSINYEKIAALRPDLILVWSEGLKAAQLHLLEKILPTGVYVSKSPSLTHIADSLIQIGLLTGMKDTAQQSANKFRQELEQLQIRYRRKPPVPVTWLFWLEPPLAAGGQHWIDEVIQICGGINPYTAINNQVIRLNQETLLTNNALILHSFDVASPRFSTQAINAEKAVLLERPSLRIMDGIKSLCHAISKTPLTH